MKPSIIEVNECILAIQEHFQHRLPIDFRVRQHFHDLYGVPGTHKATFSQQSPITPGCSAIALFVQNHQSLEDVQRTLQHEIAGHLLLTTYNNEEQRRILESLVISRNDPSFAPTWAKVAARHPYVSLAEQAEEVFAMAAETIDLTAPPPIIGRRRLGNEIGTVDLRDLRKEIALGCTELAHGMRSLNLESSRPDLALQNLSLDKALPDLSTSVTVKRSPGMVHFKI